MLGRGDQRVWQVTQSAEQPKVSSHTKSMRPAEGHEQTTNFGKNTFDPLLRGKTEWVITISGGDTFGYYL